MQTFDFVPLYSWEVTTGYRVLITEMESGSERRYHKNRRPREWQLTFKSTPDVIREIEWFFHEHKGAFGAFLWSPPGESQYLTCRFGQESMGINWQGEMLGECQLTIREIIQ